MKLGNHPTFHHQDVQRGKAMQPPLYHNELPGMDGL
jgi:hypothetical protein